MKHTRIIIALWTLILIASSLGAQESPESIFARYFANGQAVANKYPREKVHVHFDNTSYYVGDTIWYKAYVTTAEQNRFSNLSKPLYVELLDQLGNMKERQIIELNNGEASGQFVLTSTLFSGYYEIRAYTKWMLAFDEKQYFSRTFPIYRKRRSELDDQRSIVTYKMDDSMKQRPKHKEKKFTMHFYPEGGQLIQGITSAVAFEVNGRKEGPVNIKGVIKEQSGEKIAEFCTLHNGMGVFSYTPKQKPAIAEVNYEGKNTHFSYRMLCQVAMQ